MSILLSAGHNPIRKGACNDEYCEYDEALSWIKLIHEMIEEVIPCEIVPTGKLHKKVDFINDTTECKLAMELHFNSNVNAKGSECLHHPNSVKGKALCESVLEEFEDQNIFQPNRGAKIGYYQMNPSKPVDYFLRQTRPVAIIVEPQFISQKEDILLNTYDGCRCIADALMKFYLEDLKS